MNDINWIKISEDKLNLHDELIDFLKKNKKPTDSEVHEWAEDKGFAVDEVEMMAYEFAANYIDAYTGGFSKGERPKDVDQKEVDMGIEVEQEHTSNKDIAEKISYDHLKEIPDYYTRLKKMEEDAKKKEEK